jgi:aspartyl-tRNA(Asn)/glutamyl-tRNA(Gln) amidotransferase subunit C
MEPKETLLTAADARYVAILAKIDLADGEAERYAEQLADVLQHASSIAAIDTEGVEPTAHPLPLENVLRSDVPKPSLDRDEVLAAAPAVEDHRFKVPRILGEAP